MTHHFEDTADGTCAFCGYVFSFGGLHIEPAYDGPPPVDLEPPDDTETWMTVRCPCCGQTGECVGDFGYVRPHRERLAAVRERAA